MYTYEKKEKEGVLKIKISKEVWENSVEEAYQQERSLNKLMEIPFSLMMLLKVLSQRNIQSFWLKTKTFNQQKCLMLK